MVGQGLIFILLALFIVQGNGRSFPENTSQKTSAEDALNNYVETTESIIDQIEKYLEGAIETFKDGINDITSGLDSKDLIRKIKEKLEKIFGEAAEQCIFHENDAIKQLALEELNETKVCAMEALMAIGDMKKRLISLLDDGYGILATVQISQEHCQKEDLQACLQVQLQPLFYEVENLQRDYSTLESDLLRVRREFKTCLKATGGILTPEVKVITSNIEKCLGKTKAII